MFILLSGNKQAIVSFAIVFVLSSAIQSLITRSSTVFKIGISVLLIGAIGLPYTPSYGIWLSSSLILSDFYLVCYNLFLALGLVYAFFFTQWKANIEQKMEKWAAAIAKISPVFLLIVIWILGFWLKSGEISVIDFLLPIILIVLIVFIFFANRSERFIEFKERLMQGQNIFISRIGGLILRIIDLNWILVFLSWINKLFGEVTRILTLVLDGEGGLLWAFVFLILISTILVTNRLL